MSKTNQTIREREINVRTIIYNLINMYQPYPKLITEHKEAIDQALKEISELLVECKPEKLGTVGTWSDTGQKVLAGSSEDIAYNKALDDYEKNIKEVLR